MTTGGPQTITLPDDLPQPLTHAYLNRWQAFLRAAEAAGIHPLTHSEVLNSSKYVFAFSDFVAASCTRDPALLRDLIDSGDLLRHRQSNDYGHKLKGLLADVRELARDAENRIKRFVNQIFYKPFDLNEISLKIPSLLTTT